MRLFSTNSLVNSFNFLSIADAFVAQQIRGSLDIMEKQLFSRVFFRVLYLRKEQVVVRFFHQKGLLARRSYRASLPPTLMGLATFSLVLVLFGGVVYAAAVPALIVQNPVIQSVVESVTASRDESADAADSSSQSSGSKSFSSGPVASSNSGGVSFPGVSPLAASSDNPDISSDSSNEEESSSTEESQGDFESGEGGSQDPRSALWWRIGWRKLSAACATWPRCR